MFQNLQLIWYDALEDTLHFYNHVARNLWLAYQIPKMSHFLLFAYVYISSFFPLLQMQGC